MVRHPRERGGGLLRGPSLAAFPELEAYVSHAPGRPLAKAPPAKRPRERAGRVPRDPSLAAFPELATYESRTPERLAIRIAPLPRPRMQPSRPARILRSILLAVVAGGSIAAAIGFGAWHLLPYLGLNAGTPAERFASWEGVMWGLGLAATLFGLAALLNATDLYSRRPLEQVQQQASDALRGRTLYSDLPAVPWMLLGCGAALLVIAALARSMGMG
jgi:hypothetical protein